MFYGDSKTRFVMFCIAATMSAAAGSQLVHMFYRPLDDLEGLVEESLKKKKLEKTKV